jgi:hypothetical protein
MRALALVALTCACGTVNNYAVEPDDAPATADIDALAAVSMCSSTYEDAVAALGKPYRDGMAHKLRVVSWKVRPAEGRAPTPLVLAFANNVAVDICYDLPGVVACELRDECND